MKIIIQYPSGKLEVFKNVTNIEDARKTTPNESLRNVGLIFETKNRAIHRRDFKDIKAFQIVGSNRFETVLEKQIS